MTIESQVNRILGKIQRGEDPIRYWAQYQTSKRKERSAFAVVKISGECIDKSLEAIAGDLADLYKLGLIPIVTHGWGKVLDKRLREAGIETRKVNGDRYTDQEVMRYVEEIALETQRNLIEALRDKKVRVRAIGPEHKVVIAKGNNAPGYGENNGLLVRINPDPMFEAIKDKHIPVLLPLGVSEDGLTHYNINVDAVGTATVREIDPDKEIMITQSGGVLNGEGKVISEIVIKRDYESLPIEGGMRKKIDEIKQSLLLREHGEDKSVQIAAPGNLLQELFSHRQAPGTYVRLGYDISVEPLYMSNPEKIRALVRRVFGRELIPSFFTEPKQIHFAYHGSGYKEPSGPDELKEGDYKGLAVVIDDPLSKGVDYLDLIAVDCPFKNKGLGSDLLESVQRLQKEKLQTRIKKQNPEPRLFLRCREERETNRWYLEKSNVCVTYTDNQGIRYNAFFMGIDGEKNHNIVVEGLKFLRARPSNFQ